MGTAVTGRDRGRRGRPRPWWREAAWAVARRPELWSTALTQAFRLARRGWWRRRPFLPLPDPAYLRFRLRTAYGPGGTPPPEDVVAYLRWCRDFPARRRFSAPGGGCDGK